VIAVGFLQVRRVKASDRDLASALPGTPRCLEHGLASNPFRISVGR
jgi:hypothetical protein